MQLGNPSGVRRQRVTARFGALSLVLFLAGLATPVAAMNRVDPGKLPKLDADEGLVLIAVDSAVPLEAVHVRKEGGSIFGAGVLARLPAGRTLRLYSAPAGRFEWNKISTYAGVHYPLGKDPEYDFEVKAGQITYAGDLIFRPLSLFRATIHVSNRGLAALDWLQAEHPALLADHAFTYVGHYPDPFPAFHREQREAPGAKAPPYAELAKPPAPRALKLSPADLWRPERIDLIELSPSGTLLAMQVREEGKESWTIDLIDLASGESHRVARSAFAFDSMAWSGDRTLLVSLGNYGARQLVNVILVDADANGRRRFERHELPIAGRILDVLADDPQHILFASYGAKGDLMVHKVDVSNAKAIKAFRARHSDRLNAGSKDDLWWYADGRGALRVAVVRRDDEPMLVLGGAAGFVDLLRLRSDGGFVPDALSFDGTTIYGFSDEDRGQRDLVAFDVAARRVGATLYSKPGVDLDSIIYDHRRTPIGVRYYREGRLASDYFADQDRRLGGLLERAFPGQSVAVIQRSHDARHLVLQVDASDAPPKLYHLDVAQRRAALLEELMPWLDGRQFAPTHVVRAKGRDGLPIEAYLTLPPGAGKRPLVVYAHGGPVGISDTLHFGAGVQFMASLGYAVLRVNFRGSEGYGKAFREAGHQNHGTAIEDDIDAALTLALAEHPLDATRICAVGFSYGGYSALISAIRWPQRFRCAASVAGVSDRLLFFTASDAGRSEKGREGLERVVGNPHTQQAQMIEFSPLYRYRDLQVPVMLIHGDEDLRVDFEHARRLKRMLDIAGRPPVGLVFEGEGHGFAKPENTHALWNAIAGFLQQHLEPAATTTSPAP